MNQLISPELQQMLIDLGYTGEPMFQKVSVKERLPKDKDRVIVIFLDGGSLEMDTQEIKSHLERQYDNRLRLIEYWLESGIAWGQAKAFLWEKDKITFQIISSLAGVFYFRVYSQSYTKYSEQILGCGIHESFPNPILAEQEGIRQSIIHLSNKLKIEKK